VTRDVRDNRRSVPIKALASDYDGTLASLGKVAPKTVAAVRELKKSGRKFLLVTGRRIEDLVSVFPEHDLCDVIVAENGAVLYWPGTKKSEVLAAAPPQIFIRTLYEKRVPPLAVGQVVVAMLTKQLGEVESIIVELGLDLQCILNNESMMVLPKGVDKGTGLTDALGRMGLSPSAVVGVGDAENDEVLLSACGVGAVVANALPSLKDLADITLEGGHGDGVRELIEGIVADDLRSRSRR
jgi:hydroxymethylpyrimidine pyrophosphatase-like HAD family hydrolase